ncbi:MAG TPA: hypothetical protein PKY27_11520 [Arachnia sp.]|nr:hypothetical protein [Arachnia sp.]HQD22873.1 hypothetical protein [Arachnia sp.]
MAITLAASSFRTRLRPMPAAAEILPTSTLIAMSDAHERTADVTLAHTRT